MGGESGLRPRSARAFKAAASFIGLNEVRQRGQLRNGNSSVTGSWRRCTAHPMHCVSTSTEGSAAAALATADAAAEDGIVLLVIPAAVEES